MPSKFKAHQRYTNKAGKIVPGATTVINLYGDNKGALMGWMRKECLAGRDPYKVRDSAADIGTVAHALVEEHVHKALGDDNFKALERLEYSPLTMETAEKAFNAFLHWEENANIEYIGAELQLASDEFRYGGTIDIVAKLNGELTIIDLKTSKAVYDDHKIQIGAYRNLYAENKGEMPKAFILQLSKKDGLPYPHPISDTIADNAFEMFKHLLGLYYLRDHIK